MDVTVFDPKIVRAIRTPIELRFLGEDPKKSLFSEVLLNKLSALDFRLKFGSTLLGKSSNNISPNKNGFPQLYLGFNLFGLKGISPQEYLDKSVGINRVAGILTLTKDLFNYPNTLKFDTVKGQFINKFFFLPPESPSTFRFPVGHLVYKQSLGGLNFKAVVLRTGTESNNSAVYFIQMSGSGLDFTIFGQNGSTLKTEDANPIAVPQQSIKTVDGLYFISPFTDMTVERIMQLPSNIKTVGFRSFSTDDKLLNGVVTLGKDTNRTTEGEPHVKGWAFDLYPDFVVASSNSRLVTIKNARKHGSDWGPLHERFQSFIAPEFFRDIPPFEIITDGGEIGVQDPEGNSLGTTRGPLFHLAVTQEDIKNYLNAVVLQPKAGV